MSERHQTVPLRSELRVLKGGAQAVPDERLRPPDWQPAQLPNPQQSLVDSNVRLYIEQGLMLPFDGTAAIGVTPGATFPAIAVTEAVIQQRETPPASQAEKQQRLIAVLSALPDTTEEQRRLLALLAERLEK
jgi:hypothetical protein